MTALALSCIAVGVGIHHIAAHTQYLLFAYIEVQAQSLRFVDAVGAAETTEPAPVGVGEAKLIGVVEITEQCNLVAVPEFVDIERAGIALVCTVSGLYIAEVAVLHIFFHREVYHGFIFAVVHTGESGKIALAVHDLKLVNHVYRQVLGCHFRVVTEKFLSVNEDF